MSISDSEAGDREEREDAEVAEERDDRNLLPGVGAVALFLLLAIVFVRARFGPVEGFPAEASVVEAIGYAMFNLDGGGVPSAGFLAAFEIVDLVLVAALVGSVMLARREGEAEGTLSEDEGGGQGQEMPQGDD
jgi:NADH-quinone oxidoreductase subunit J